MAFGRIYSIYDSLKRRTVYCGQTVNKRDRCPHGSKISTAWKNNRSRYEYVVEEEHEEISRDSLNELEVFYVMEHHRTFNDINDYGMNFDTGGKSNGKLSGETLLRYSLASKKKWSNEDFKNKMMKQRSSEDYKKMLSERTTKAMNDPIVKKRTFDARKVVIESVEYRAKLSASIKAAMNREEVKEKFKGKNNYRYSGCYVVPNKNLGFDFKNKELI